MAGERTREIWTNLNPDLKEALGHLAANNDGGQITPELETAIIGNMAQDAAEAQQEGEF